MKPHSVAIVGAAETTELGKIPDMSNIQLHADAALNALADAGLKPSDIDGVACCREEPTEMAYYLGITPKWVDGTAVGGTSFLIHVRHAAAAIASGLCSTVLITHGESGRSNVAKARPPVHPGSLNGQFETPYGVLGPPTYVHDSRAALHEEIQCPARKDCDGLGRAARMGGEKSARHVPRPDHGRATCSNSRMIA